MASSTDEKITFGATVVPATAPMKPAALQPPTLESPALTPVASRDGAYSEVDMPTAATPQSPFYQHPPASFERVQSRPQSKQMLEPFEKDLEAGNITPLSSTSDENPFASKISLERNKECKMWPSRQTLMQAKQADKHKKRTNRGCTGCAPIRAKWEAYSKCQRLMIKMCIALLVIGVVVAIAVGVTKAVNGSVYDEHGNHPIGSTKR
ncbi:Hypothetical protein R9X50_00398400 [Acrodontium crateriforme]|uniref:Uncharacterized protein n=1 Tax=Acrodontium crateriforme TaxID=150365 RepID=A0AAQ3M4G2_9PEZI|nr:Hypothetical protein R9X50_00398400 [Acrodontium crateriforme]